MAFLCFAVPYIIIGAISGFHKGNSTYQERSSIWLWIGNTSLYAIYGLHLHRLLPRQLLQTGGHLGTRFPFPSREAVKRIGIMFLVIAGIECSTNGLWTVSKMIRETGMCEVY